MSVLRAIFNNYFEENSTLIGAEAGLTIGASALAAGCALAASAPVLPAAAAAAGTLAGLSGVLNTAFFAASATDTVKGWFWHKEVGLDNYYPCYTNKVLGLF